MEALWTIDEIAQATGGEARGVLPLNAGGIAIDSRSLAPGDVFFAVKGDRLDGHDYAEDAYKRGAALLVLDKAHENLAQAIKAPCLIVADAAAALRALAQAARARLAPCARIAAITGSAGKTTVKEMLAQILSAFGSVHKSPASYNNHWGVPLTLARMPRGTDYAILEIGMNHAGEIAPLAALVKPHLALITQIAAAHMGNFNSLEEIAAAKAEIFSGLASGGAALLNRDDAHYAFLRGQLGRRRLCVCLSFGKSRGADYRLAAVRESALGLNFSVYIQGHGESFFMPAHGAHMAVNACAAIGAAAQLIRSACAAAAEKAAMQAENAEAAALPRGAAHRIRAALAEFHAVAGRGARYECALAGQSGSFTLIDESYNANPASMRAALSVLARHKGRKIAVLGDMLELGQAARAEHEALAAPLIKAGAARVFLIGGLMRALAAKLQEESGISVCHYAKAEEAAAPLKASLRGGDCVMVKASHSLHTEKIVSALREHCP